MNRTWMTAGALLALALFAPWNLAGAAKTKAKPKPAASTVLRGTSAGTAAATVPTVKPAAKPAATQPPATGWSEAEVAAAKAECTSLLKRAALAFTYAPPIRKGACGTPQPVIVTAFGGKPSIAVDPPATMNCAMAAKLADWLGNTVQPLAQGVMGAPVIGIRNAAAYDCRNRYNDPGQKLSEHAKANALDIHSFKFANGKSVDVEGSWGAVVRDMIAKAKGAKTTPGKSALGFSAKIVREDGSEVTAAVSAMPAPGPAKPVKGARAARHARAAEAAALGISAPAPGTPGAIFIHGVHASACKVFGTVLGPEANDAHREHFHLDLTPRKTGAFCE